MSDLFPLKLASGKSFFNRKNEMQKLQQNIENVRHTVLISPRRYGKSSLVNEAVRHSKHPFASVDLFLANNNLAVTKRILKGISELISVVLPVDQKVLGRLQGLFGKFRVTLGVVGFNIEASFDGVEADPVEQVFDALSVLDGILKKENKKVVFFIDEFQDIANAKASKSIQGAIRHIAQQSHNLMFIFSGSNRHLLLELFDDSFMPLYMLCEKIYLERISGKDYQLYLGRLYQKKWGLGLPEDVLLKILQLTEKHTFYVNLLCSKVWRLHQPPKVLDVEKAWGECCSDERRRIKAELEKLSKNQQELLKALAINPTSEPNGQQFLVQTGLAMSSIRQTISVLIEKDMIFQVSQADELLPLFEVGQYRVLDPLIKYVLRSYV